MILRTWRGTVRRGSEESYIDYLKTKTFPAIEKLKGFVKAQILSCEIDQGTEFCVTTQWESLEAIRAFAGDALMSAVVPVEVQGWMVSFDQHVQHYEIDFEFCSSHHER